MPVSHNLTPQQLADLQTKITNGDYIGFWTDLAQHGDAYADNAAAVTGGTPSNAMDQIMQDLVKIHWDNTAGPGMYEQYFDDVALEYAQRYFQILNNTTDYPNTDQIVNAYQAAINEIATNNSITLNPEVVFDSVWAAMQAVVAAAGIPVPDWNTLLGMEGGRDTGTPGFGVDGELSIGLLLLNLGDLYELYQNQGQQELASAVKNLMEKLEHWSMEVSETADYEEGEPIITCEVWWQLAEGAPGVVRVYDPLVFDLDGDGIELTSREDSKAYFNISGTEFAHLTGWASGGDGMLVDDANSNGEIDDVSELIGGNSGSGFGDLISVYDTNQDGVLDSSDTNYGRLRIWVDADEDGRTDSGELHTLASLDITAINLNAIDTDYEIAGNHITQQSTFVMDGQTRTVVDAWYAFDTVNTVYNDPYTLDPRVLFLPEQRGYGELPNLSIAMSLDEDLLEMVQDIAARDAEELFEEEYDLQAALEAVLFKWAGVEEVEPDYLADGIDEQKLAFLEKVLGQEYNGNIYGYGALAEAWVTVFGAFAANIMAQAGLGVAMGGAFYDPVTDTLSGGWGEESRVMRFGTDDQWQIFGSPFGDAYVFGEGDTYASGTTIHESGGTEDDMIYVDADWEDMEVWGSSDGYLYIRYGEGDEIRVAAGYDYVHDEFTMNGVERLAFRDGVRDLTGGLHMRFNDTGGIINGTAYGDLIEDGIGSTYIHAGRGDDTLSGGAGVDFLYGGAGDDTYVFVAGDSGTSLYEKIYENAGEGVDTVLIHGVDPEDVYLWTDGSGNIVVRYTENDILTIVGGFDYVTNETLTGYVERIVFDDETVWDLTAGLHIRGVEGLQSVFGTVYGDIIEDGPGGSSWIFAGAGDDIIIGGDGHDFLYGEEGADIFVMTGFSNYERIDDFNAGEGDVIDIANLLEEYDQLTDALADFVEITDDGTSSYLSVDLDGAGTTHSMAQVAIISGVTGLTDEAALVTAGTLVVT